MTIDNNTLTTSPITFRSCNTSSKHVTGGALQTYINTSYRNLVNHFGEPTIETDGYKTSSEWHVEVIIDGVVQGAVAIYDYKQCETYAGVDGLEPQHITQWHVGCKTSRLAGLVVDLINNKSN